MNVNSTYSIGKDHITCEDYAISGNDGELAYAIVCDGCSASPDVDFGARVIAKSAEFMIKSYHNDNEVDYNLMGKMIIAKAKKIFEIFPTLHSQALDATLLMAWVKNNKLRIFTYGDGIVVLRNKYGTHAHQIHLTSGAPDYLSYYLNIDRKWAYDDLENNIKELWTLDGVINYNPFDYIPLDFPVEAGDTVSVISDGINSFRRSDNTPIPWRELVDEFTGYKTTEGEFVLRRINAFKRKCLKEGITHYDDISVSSIVI